MANKKITELTATTAAALADGDLFLVVDVSDTTDATTGTPKKLPKSELREAAGVATHEADTTNVHGITDTSTLYRSGGTDVAVTDGGTGSSTASGARTNLGLDYPTIATNVATDTALSSRFAALKTQVVKSASGTTAVNDYVLASTAGGAISLSLPTGAAVNDEVHIKNVGSNACTVTAGALTIDGVSSYVINGKHEDQVFRFDGVNWRTAQSQLPLVFVQDQLATQYNAAGVNDDFCLTIANQITTGAAADGVHDLVLLARNNPSIGDADIYFTRDDVNTTGVIYCHMPIKSAHGLQIQDSNGVALFDMHATSGAIGIGGVLTGDNGGSNHLRLATAGAGSELRIQKADGTARLTYAETSDVFTVGYLAQMTFAMLSGSGGSFVADSSNRLNVTGGAGGIRILNNAFNAVNLTLTDAGNVVMGRTAPSTTATAGFPYMPATNGTPTGAATAQAGFVPFVYDTSANKLWIYNGSWRGVVVS